MTLENDGLVDELVHLLSAQKALAETNSRIAEATSLVLARQCSRLQATLDHLSVPIFFKDAQGVYRGCNKAFEAYIGKASADIVGKTVHDVAPPPLAAAYEEADRKLLESGGTQVYEARVRYADGSDHDVVFHKAVFHDAEGRVDGLAGAMLDITDRKQLESTLQAEKATAEKANAAKSHFLATASHDLRQPMHALSLYLAAIDEGELPAPAASLLGKARQCVHAMEEMFHALLDLSRLDAGAVQPETASFPIAELLDRVRNQFEPEARAKQLTLRVAPCALWVRGDPAMIERILHNLVSNAIRHIERGRILVGCRRRGPHVRVMVHDTGPGIPADEQQAIFDEFFQLANPDRDRTKGLGLGLAIVKRLATLLSIPVMLKSDPGRGAMFAIDLPRALEDGVLSASSASAMTAPATGVLVGRLIVVIDNEESILDATRSLLAQWGCAAVTATHAAQAIAYLRTSNRIPDALICDFRLRGGEDGIGAIAAVRAAFEREIPALLVTGDTAVDRIQEIVASRLPVLHKPLDENKFRRALAKMIAASDQRPAQ